jgi:hypothetical protein
LLEKDATKTWTSGGDIGSIPLDIGREHASGEKRPARAAPNRETPAPGVSPKMVRECECLLALDPLRRHNTTTNSVAYADYYRTTGFGCPIS